jgi:peptidoglycan/xylan/chitin deacetylase (PgdA/CDA1 family)
VIAWIAAAGWTLVGAGGVWLARALREESRADRIVCLLYHRVVPRSTWETFRGTERIFSIPEDRFRGHLERLCADGYHFVSLDELEAHLARGEALPARPVFVSFDDGCESVAKVALPILRDLRIPATAFVTIDEGAWIFRSGEYFERRMSHEELRACHEGGVSIGSHSVTHRGLNEMRPDEALDELVRSRELLSEWVGAPVRHFAVPLNFYNRSTLELCRRAGYTAVCTSDNGTCNRDTDPFRIRRFIVEGGLDVEAFARTLAPHVIVQRRVLNALKKIPPKLLGETLWMPLRRRIFRSALGRHLGLRQLRRALLAAAVAGVAGLVALTIAALR